MFVNAIVVLKELVSKLQVWVGFDSLTPHTYEMQYASHAHSNPCDKHI